jgi:hypothetical protein
VLLITVGTAIGIAVVVVVRQVHGEPLRPSTLSCAFGEKRRRRAPDGVRRG